MTKEIYSNMAGTIIQILVSVGEVIQAGQDVVVIESMKMEVPIPSELTGKVVEIRVEVGDFINDGEVLLTLE